MNGDYIFVGAPSDTKDVNGGGTAIQGSGSVYIFKRTTNISSDWLQFKKITAPVRSNNAYFGNSIGISGNYGIVGSYGESDVPNTIPQTQVGAAHILKNSGGADSWGQIQRI